MNNYQLSLKYAINQKTCQSTSLKAREQFDV